MIYNDGNSELHIRLHIADMLKDKVEQDNYNELCEKALKFVMNGIELPKIKKTPAEEAADMFTKTFLFSNPLQDALKELKKGDLPKSNDDELKELCDKNIHESVLVYNHKCFICGYSTEFDCLIAGTNEDCDNDVKIGENDVIIQPCKHYFYVGKGIIKND
jgi:hypothetical protein